LNAFSFRNDLSRVQRNNPRAAVNTTQAGTTPVSGSAAANASPHPPTESYFNAQARNEPSSEIVPKYLSESCRQSLANIMLYESGLNASDICAKAIAKVVCFKNESTSKALIHQVISSCFYKKNTVNNNLLHVRLRPSCT